MISWQDFEQVDIRVGKVLEAQEFEAAHKPAYVLKIDFGALGIKKSSAQLTKDYLPDDLVGRQVAAVVNFPPKQIGPISSEVLVLGFPSKDNTPILIQPERDVPLGGKLY